MTPDAERDIALAWAKESQAGEMRELGLALHERHGAGFLSLLRELQQPNPDEGLPFTFPTVEEFLASLGELPPMLVEGLLPQNSLILVSGKPKHAKSFLALDILDSVRLGAPVFGKLAVNTSGPVVYIGLEDSDPEIGTRLVKRGARRESTHPFRVGRGVRKLDARSLGLVKQQMEEIKPALLCIDTAREACGIRDWNDAGEVSGAIRPFREFAREVCTVILVAHNRKAEGSSGDEINGSNAFASSVDGWISIQRKDERENGNLRLFAEVDGRGGMRGKLTLEMDTTNLHFREVTGEELTREKVAASASCLDERIAAVRDAITAAARPLTIREISDASGIPLETARKLIPELAQSGNLAKVADKGGPRRNAPEYALPEPGRAELENLPIDIGRFSSSTLPGWDPNADEEGAG